MKNDASREWAFRTAVISGVLFIGVVTFLLIRNEPIRDPNLAVFARIILAFAVAACGAAIPGTLRVEWLKGIVIRSSGAVALFVLTLTFTPKVFPMLDTTRIELDSERLKSVNGKFDALFVTLKNRVVHLRDQQAIKQILDRLDQYRAGWKRASDEYIGDNPQQFAPSLEDQENALAKMENILRDMETFARSIPEKPLDVPIASEPEQSSNIVDVPVMTNSTALNSDAAAKPVPTQVVPAPPPANNTNTLSPPTEIAKINDGFKPGVGNGPPNPSSSVGTNSNVTTTNGGPSITPTNKIHRPAPPGAPHVVP